MFPITDYSTKKENKLLTINAKDFDVFSANDMIGSTTLNLTDAVNCCVKIKKRVRLDAAYVEEIMDEADLEYHDQDSFWLPLYKDGEDAGAVRIQIELLPQDKADIQPVGEGRSEPNHSPFLPPPTGRLQWSLNPFTMFN